MKLWEKLVSLAVGLSDGALVLLLWKIFIIPFGHSVGKFNSSATMKEGWIVAITIGFSSFLLSIYCFIKNKNG